MQNFYTWWTDKPDINNPGTIHQILAYGNLEALKDLKKNLGEQKLKQV